MTNTILTSNKDTVIAQVQSEERNLKGMKKRRGPFIQEFEDPEAQEFAEKIEHYRSCAKNAIKIGQAWME